MPTIYLRLFLYFLLTKGHWALFKYFEYGCLYARQYQAHHIQPGLNHELTITSWSGHSINRRVIRFICKHSWSLIWDQYYYGSDCHRSDFLTIFGSLRIRLFFGAPFAKGGAGSILRYSRSSGIQEILNSDLESSDVGYFMVSNGKYLLGESASGVMFLRFEISSNRMMSTGSSRWRPGRNG